MRGDLERKGASNSCGPSDGNQATHSVPSVMTGMVMPILEAALCLLSPILLFNLNFVGPKSLFLDGSNWLAQSKLLRWQCMADLHAPCLWFHVG